MALSRAHTSVKAADVAKLLVLKQMRGKQSDAAMRSMAVTPTPGDISLPIRSTAIGRAPHLTVTLTPLLWV